jgi:dienelactone hydrolase
MAMTSIATPDARLERVKTSWRPRLLANGIEPFDYERTSARVERFEDWAEVAAEHERGATEAGDVGHRTTAAGLYRLAALAWHFGFFAHPRPLDAWLEAQRRKAALFRNAAPFLWPAAEFVSIPFGAVELPAYIRKPADAVRPPVVLFVSGLDSTKEEHTTFENGPGQGEVWEHLPGIIDWERAASAMVDFVSLRSDLDPARVGILGVSLGGYLAPRCAALEPRLRAAVGIGGLFELLGNRDLGDNLHTPRLLHFWNVPDVNALRPLLAASTLDGVIQRLDRPLLVVHGERDDITPVAGGRRIYDEARGPKDWLLFPEGNHVCNNIPHIYRPMVADWLADKLS